MSRRHGFTLIELLVVITILSILAGLGTLAVLRMMGSARISSTEQFLGQVSAAAAQYQIRFGDYPPSTPAELGYRPSGGNLLNQGGEALVVALASKKRGTPFSVDEERLQNADGDTADKNFLDSLFVDNQLREYKDWFGGSVAYLHHRNFDAPKPENKKVRVQAGEKDQDLLPAPSQATKWVNAGRFQLRSAGPDGLFGTKDDVWPAGN